LIKIRDLKKQYKMGEQELWALAGVSLEIAGGEFVAIMGASGSGKSTLMNLLGCLDSPTSGDYELEGATISGCKDVELARIRNRSIGFVFQSFNLLPRMSAVENVELPLLYSQVRAPERRQRALAALGEVGLGERIHHKPNQLSGGQQQRVAIARSIINRPRLLLADEPTGALDSKTSEEIMELFLKLNAEGMTVVLVTHEPDIATYAGRVIRLRDGRILSDERKKSRLPV
jgi:putative ABC transport system ATP-binding protein